jgi:hypothetical protein
MSNHKTLSEDNIDDENFRESSIDQVRAVIEARLITPSR